MNTEQHTAQPLSATRVALNWPRCALRPGPTERAMVRAMAEKQLVLVRFIARRCPAEQQHAALAIGRSALRCRTLQDFRRIDRLWSLYATRWHRWQDAYLDARQLGIW